MGLNDAHLGDLVLLPFYCRLGILIAAFLGKWGGTMVGLWQVSYLLYHQHIAQSLAYMLSPVAGRLFLILAME